MECSSGLDLDGRIAKNAKREEIADFMAEDDLESDSNIGWDKKWGGLGNDFESGHSIPIDPAPLGMQAWDDTVCRIKKI